MGVRLLDAGRYGLPRYLFQTLLYLLHPCSRVLTRHFPHPVGRFHQHDGEGILIQIFPKILQGCTKYSHRLHQ